MDQTLNRDFVVRVVIPAGASESNVLDLRGASSIAFYMPAEWTSADLKLMAAPKEDMTFVPVVDAAAGEPVVVSVTVSSMRIFIGSTDSTIFRGLRFIKLESVSVDTGEAVAQEAEREFWIIGKV